MKGFLSLILALLFAATILSLFMIYLALTTKNDQTRMELFLLEMYNTREVELKHAMIDMLAHETRAALKEEAIKVLGREPTLIELFHFMTGDEITAAVGNKLKELEELQSYYKSNFSTDIDFWCGTITAEEKVRLPQEMLETGVVKKCTNCWDFSAPAERVETDKIRSVTVCTALLLVILDPTDPEIKISSPDPRVDPAIPSKGEVVFGVSILDKRDGLASIITLPVGSRIRW